MIVDSNGKLDIYREALVLYKNLLQNNIEEYLGLPRDVVQIRDSTNKQTTKAPLIVIGRSSLTDYIKTIPQDQIVANATGDSFATTCMLLDYPIRFDAFGNTYLESDRLSTFCLDIFISTSVSVVRSYGDWILSAMLQSWSEPTHAEQDSSIIVSSVTGLLRMQISTSYKL